MTITVGTIHKAPLDVSSTGWVKVVGSNVASSQHAPWELIAVEYDPQHPEAVLADKGFKVTEHELRKWGEV